MPNTIPFTKRGEEFAKREIYFVPLWVRVMFGIWDPKKGDELEKRLMKDSPFV